MHLWNDLLDVFFPRTCPICQEPLESGSYLCPNCLSRLDRTEQALNRENETEKYFAGVRHFAYGGSWLHYSKGTYLQRLIHQAKYGNGKPELLKQLGREAAREWIDSGFFDGIDVIVPIPLHKGRLRERGFNQSQVIVEGMNEVLHLPMDTDHLTRHRATGHQANSNYETRQMGVQGAFVVNHPEEWYHKTIMLVDDIITTGATMRSAMDALVDVYGCRIVVFSLAKTI